MTLTAIGMVKDEDDVIGDVVRHLASEGVERIAILDNGSTDRTTDAIWRARKACPSVEVAVVEDPEPGYYQSKKVSELARAVCAEGDWIIPFDADELWHADVRLSEFFNSVEADIEAVDAGLLSHFGSPFDPPAPTVFKRFNWRDPDVAPLPKVAVRYQDGLVIEQGNHGANVGRRALCHLGGSSLTVRHFPYRSPAQMIRKIRNGAAAYAASDLSPMTGLHWRQLGTLTDEEIIGVFLTEYWHTDPRGDGQIHDPAPFCRWST